jgi:predicted dinucleotide-binding enzyme
MAIAIIGTGHIGSAIAEHLVENGQAVLVANRNMAKAETLAKKLGQLIQAVSVEEAIKQADTIILAIWFADEKELIQQYDDALRGKLIIDPSNPIQFDAAGQVSRTLPEGTSAGKIIRDLLPKETLYAKAFGSIGADDLASATGKAEKQIVLYFAADTDEASRRVAKLIDQAGFAPFQVGDVADTAIDIEVGGRLHPFGGLNGVVPTVGTLKPA